MYSLSPNQSYLIKILLDLALSGAILLTLTPLKYSSKNIIVKTIPAIISLILLFHIMLRFVDITYSQNLSSAFSIVILYIFGHDLSSVKGSQFLFVFLTVYILKRFGIFLSSLATINFINNAIFYTGVQIIIILVLTLIIIRYIKKPFFDMLYDIKLNWSALCTLPLIFNIALSKFEKIPADHDTNFLHLKMSFLLFGLCFTIYYVISLYFQDVSYTLKLEKDAEMLELQKSYQKQEYLEMVSRLESLRMYRHDMRHHLNVIHSLISSEDYTKAKKYIEDLIYKYAR